MGDTYIIMDIKNKNNKDLISLMEELKSSHIDTKNKAVSLLSDLDKIEGKYQIVIKELKDRHIVK